MRDQPLAGSSTISPSASELKNCAQEIELVGTGSIAHELNNLLTVIVFNAEFLCERLDAREDLQRFARDIAKAGDRGAQLTEQLMAGSIESDSRGIHAVVR
jgi:signal transduction histidine kinase